jgi:dienelactone hydrolase
VSALGVAMTLAVIGGLLVSTASAAAGSVETARAHRRDAPRIFVAAHEIMADDAFHIAVGNLEPGELVTLRLTIDAGAVTVTSGTTWDSTATFRAGRRGAVDLSRDAPVAGSYNGVDPMGLFWSARPTMVRAVPNASPITERTHLDAIVAGRPIASTELVLDFLRPHATATSVDEAGLVGTLFEPAGGGRHPAMVVFGGSEGGKLFTDPQAALFASHGYVALSLAYFGLPGLPADLSDIPLEYFGRAIDWLAHQPRVDPDRIGVRGGSRGGELALLLGTRFPQLRAVVAAAPSSVVWSGTSMTDLTAVFRPAWTDNGQPVPFLIPDIASLFTAGPFQSYLTALHAPAAASAAIPVEDINGPVLLMNGADDQLWPSPEMSEQVLARLRANHHPFPDELISFPGTGHVITLPGLPTTTDTAGGDPADSARAARAAWAWTLRFLDENLACAFPTRARSPVRQLATRLEHRSCVVVRRIGGGH